mgnify:FL=1
MGNPVVHFEIIGKDANTLRKFYTQAFSWHFDPPGGGVNAENYGLAQTQAGVGIDGGIGDMGAANGYAGHVTFYVGVPDIKAALDKIAMLGGKRVMGPETVPGGPTIALFTDPEDHLIGLVET